MSGAKSLLLVGKVRPERKRSLTGMAVSAQMPLVAVDDATEAVAWLDDNDPACLVVDAGVARLDRVITKIRGRTRLAHVPVLALVSTPDDLWIEQYFGWGGDDVVQMDAGATLLERLRAVPREIPPPVAGRRAVIGEVDQSRLEVLGRVLGLAGFDTHCVTERSSLETTILDVDPSVVVVNTALGDLKSAIERTRTEGSQAAWAVLAARREFDAQLSMLGSVTRCFVAGIQSNPWQILTRLNELTRTDSVERRSEPRLAFGSFVLFRAAGSDDDEVGVAYNLSSHGMFVRTYAPVTSEDVWLEWRVPQDKTRVRLEGKVAWRQSTLTAVDRAACPLGFGVEFCDYLGRARKHLERAIEVLEATARRGSAGSQSVAPIAGAKAETSSSPPAEPATPSENGSAAIKPPVATSSNGQSVGENPGQATPTSQVQAPGEAKRAAAARSPALESPANVLKPRTAQPGAGGNLQSAATAGDQRGRRSVSEAPGSRVPRTAGLGKPQDESRGKSTSEPPPARKSMVSERPSARVSGDGKPNLTDSGRPAANASGGGEKPEPARRQPAPPSSVRLTAPQVPRFDGPPRPKGMTAVAAPPRPGRLNATVLGLGTPAPPTPADSAPNSSPPALTADASTDAKATGGQGFEAAVAPLAAAELAEGTKADAATQTPLLEAAGAASEATDLTSPPGALYEIAEDSLPPAADVHDDAPTVVAAAPKFDGGPDVNLPGDSEFAAEEAETSQFNAAAFRAEAPRVAKVFGALPANAAVSAAEIRVPPPPSTKKLAFALLLASLGILGGGFWFYGSMRRNADRSDAEESVASAETPSVASAPSALPTAVAEVAVAPVASVGTSGGAPMGTTAGEIPVAPSDEGGPLDGYPPVEEFQLGNGRNLADRYGYLIVRFPEAAFIFANNIAVGATNWKIATTCGEKVLRVGVGEKPVTWLSQEMRVSVSCRDTTRVVFRRLEGVVAPQGVQRPIPPSTTPRKAAKAEEGARSERETSAIGTLPVEPKPVETQPAEAKSSESGSAANVARAVRSSEPPTPVPSPVAPAAEPPLRGSTEARE